MKELYAIVNDIKLCYEIRGNGYPIILIHGYCGKKEQWIGQFEQLSKKYNTIRFDNRTSGKSDRPDKLVTMDMFAEDIKGLMDFLGIERAHIIGGSLGGMISQIFALNYPERVNKLILICTTYSGVIGELVQKLISNGLEERKKDPVKAFWDALPLSYPPRIRKQMIADPKKKFYGIWSAEDLIEDSIIDPPTLRDVINQGHSFKGFNTLERLSEIKNETLLIGAFNDLAIPFSQMAEMSERIPKSTLKKIKNAGHAVCGSHAPKVNKLILAFLVD